MLVFRQPPSNGKIFAAAIFFVPLLLAAAVVPVMITFNTESRDAGLGIAMLLCLLVAFAAFCVFYRMMTPMVVEVGRDGLTLTNQKTCADRTLRWGQFTYSLVEGTSGCVLMLHDNDETFVIRQHPAYAKSPPGFVELCEVVVEKGREFTTT